MFSLSYYIISMRLNNFLLESEKYSRYNAGIKNEQEEIIVKEMTEAEIWTPDFLDWIEKYENSKTTKKN
jgi:hypothetical protein